MKLNFLKNQTADEMEHIGIKVQSLINSEFQKVKNKPEEDSPLNQAGMRNGLEIIKEYNSEREFGLAFEHILYMIHETGIEIDKASSELITGLGEKLNISIDHIQKQLRKGKGHNIG